MTQNQGRIEAKLGALGITLPAPATPVASYVPTKRVGNLLFVAGQVPWRDGKFVAVGRVPSQVSLEVARDCAKQCALNGLAAIKAALGTLDKVKQVVRVGVFVACDQDWHDHPKVGNGASDFLVEVFGDAGRHARAAVGAPSLPLGAPVEVELLVEVE